MSGFEPSTFASPVKCLKPLDQDTPNKQCKCFFIHTGYWQAVPGDGQTPWRDQGLCVLTRRINHQGCARIREERREGSHDECSRGSPHTRPLHV